MDIVELAAEIAQRLDGIIAPEFGMGDIDAELGLGEQAHVIAPILNCIDQQIGVDVIAQFQPKAGGVVGPLFRALGGRFNIAAGDGAVFRLVAIHVHETVGANFGGKFNASLILLDIVIGPVVRRPAGRIDHQRQPDIVTDPAYPLWRPQPVEGQPALPPLPARRLERRQIRFQIGIFPTYRAERKFESHDSSCFWVIHHRITQ